MKTYLFRITKDIWSLKRSILATNFLLNLLHAVRPYIYLVFPALILDELLGEQRIQTILLWVCVGVLLNAVSLLLSGWLENLNSDNSDFCGMTEKNETTKKLMDVPFEVLENGAFAQAVARQRAETSTRGGVFCQCLRFWERTVTAALQTFVAVLALRRFRPTLFIASGSGFLGSQFFGVCIVLFALAACLLLKQIQTKMQRENRKLRDQYSDIDQSYEYYRDTISHYPTGKEIRIFQMQEFIMREATELLLTRGKRLQKQIAHREASVAGAGIGIFCVLRFCCYILVGVKAQGGLLSLAELVVCIGAMEQLIEGLYRLFNALGTLEDLAARANIHYDVMDAVIPEPEGVRTALDAPHTLEVRNVTYQYPGSDTAAVKNLSLTLRPGEKLAIVGENGSGKTTLIKLLCRLYTPQQGDILLDGQPISEYGEKEYQRLFAMVFQDFTIYSLPLGENVAVAQTYDRGKVSQLLRQVGFEPKCSLDTSLHQDCDPNGVDISGGESQKLAFARALYRNSPIVVPDEPTAAMDPASEMELYQNFNNFVQDKTAVFISHRLSSCRFCDRIIVMDNGQLIQSGTHEELLRDPSGKYYELWNAQAKYFTDN